MKDFEFLYYFVPPIIFAEGFNIRKKYLMKNIGYSFIYGYIGTLLNFLIIGALLVAVNENEDLMVIDFDPDD